MHCRTGCLIGEILGMAIATSLGWGNLESIALAIGLAFVFGYTLTLSPRPIRVKAATLWCLRCNSKVFT